VKPVAVFDRYRSLAASYSDSRLGTSTVLRESRALLRYAAMYARRSSTLIAESGSYVSSDPPPSIRKNLDA
jgi:hypothetical protein